jgi:hypothetical protein
MVLRFSTIIWMILIVVAAFGLYGVKYRVQALQEQVTLTERKLREENEALHVLQAEWAYLKRPSRLQQLSENHTPLKPMQSKQISELDSIPFPDQDTESLPANHLEVPTGNTAAVIQAGAILHDQ